MFNGNDLSRGRAKNSAKSRKTSEGVLRTRNEAAFSQPKTKARTKRSTVGAEHANRSLEATATVEAQRKSVGAVEVDSRAVGSALTSYFREIGSVPLLTIQEEIELARRIRAGDLAAREQMIRANLRLVVKIAREYENLGLPLLDLISEGTIGLMKAVEKFDPAKGGKLSTYGSWWIKQQIRRALANQGRTIRLPVHVEGKLYRLHQAEARLRDLFGREATDEELAAELAVTTKRLRRLREAGVRPSSLDAPVGEDGDATVGDLVGDAQIATPYELFRDSSDQGRLRQVLEQLPTRESQILRARFGLDGAKEETLEEIGTRFGVTRERIRQLQNEAFEKLRQLLEPDANIRLAA